MKEIKVDFPKDFFIGGAIASEQVEGHGTLPKAKTNWDTFYEVDPNAFFDKVGPSTTTDMMRHYKDDINLMKKSGIDSLRYSFSWSRLYPDGKTLSEEAVRYYKNYISELRKNNMHVVMTLYHFDMPKFIEDKGGLAGEEFPKLYAKYAADIIEIFGELVDHFVTFNEPIIPIERGYFGKEHWPRLIDKNKGFKAILNTVLAHDLAMNIFKSFNFTNSTIGAVINVRNVYPRSQTKEDLESAKIQDSFYNGSFMGSMVNGKFSDGFIDVAKKMGVNYKQFTAYNENNKHLPMDMLGINYYRPIRSKAKEAKVDNPKLIEDLYDVYKNPKAEMNEHRGWEIYPISIYDLAMKVKNEYNNIPLFISENGIGVEGEEKFLKRGTIIDDYRVDFLKRHLYFLKKAMNEGANVVGYHIWSPIDNWSWTNAYKNRYGLISVDLKTQKRTMKKSAKFFKEFADNHSFAIDEDRTICPRIE